MVAPPVQLNIRAKLDDRSYRQKFFLAEASSHIAKQLINLRKRRGLGQTEVADLIGTQQPAISRVERADYQNWSFTTLRRLAGAMDARIRVTIEPSEDILNEYNDADEKDSGVRDQAETVAHRHAVTINRVVAHQHAIPADQLLFNSQWTIHSFSVLGITASGRVIQTEKDQENARLRDENERLRKENELLRATMVRRPQEQNLLEALTPRQSSAWGVYTNEPRQLIQ